MKVFLKQGRCEGNVLVVTLVMAGVLGIAVAACLNLLTSQLNYTIRAQVWNDCMPLVEAGIEEGLAHVNNGMGTNLTGNDWNWDGGAGAYVKTRYFGDSGVDVQIYTNSPQGVVIVAKGYKPAPVTVNGSGLLAAFVPTPGVSYISRTVRVRARQDPAFNGAMVVRLTVAFKGAGIAIDSYDSSLGPYNPLTAGDKGDVVSNSDMEDWTGNAKIKGHVYTGPRAVVVQGGNGSIGSVNWVPKKGIETGWWRRDANFSIPDVAPPWTENSYGFVSLVGGAYTLMGGNYEIGGNFILGAGQTLKLQGDSWLWVRGNLKFDGNSTVIMTNATNRFRLTIYVSGSLASSGTWSKGVDPRDLIIYGLPTCKVADVTTGSAMQAVIYAPSADLNIQGNADFFGSITANTVLMNGTPGFHYDENLKKAQSFRGFIVNSWEEL